MSFLAKNRTASLRMSSRRSFLPVFRLLKSIKKRCEKWQEIINQSIQTQIYVIMTFRSMVRFTATSGEALYARGVKYALLPSFDPPCPRNRSEKLRIKTEISLLAPLYQGNRDSESARKHTPESAVTF